MTQDMNGDFTRFESNRDKPPNENQQCTVLSIATKALVYMAVGPDFKIPVGYYFISGLSVPTTAALTLNENRC